MVVLPPEVIHELFELLRQVWVCGFSSFLRQHVYELVCFFLSKLLLVGVYLFLFVAVQAKGTLLLGDFYQVLDQFRKCDRQRELAVRLLVFGLLEYDFDVLSHLVGPLADVEGGLAEVADFAIGFPAFDLDLKQFSLSDLAAVLALLDVKLRNHHEVVWNFKFRAIRA